jgi:uncharacterized protein DUF6599
MLSIVGRLLAKSLSLCGACLVVSAASLAQKPSVISLVPAADWHLISSEKLDVEAVGQWGGDPAVDREYGAKAIEHRSYRLENKAAEVVVEEGPDASSAYGLLTYYRTESMESVPGIESAASSASEALMARGRFFTRILPHAGAGFSASDLHALLTLLGSQEPAAGGAAAGFPTPLPAVGLVLRSGKYLLGPVAAHNVAPFLSPELIGFQQGAEMEVASYRTRPEGGSEKRATLVAITYPTSQIAREQFAMVQKQLRMNEGDASIFGNRKGSFVFLTFNADAKSAARILDQFNVSERVSWDQKYPGKKSPALQMLEIIVSNLILVFVLVGFSVVGGIAIVLAKRLARKWFPDDGDGGADGEGLVVLNLR